MMRYLVSILSIVLSSACMPIDALFDRDTAAAHAQNGEWKKVQNILQPLMAHHNTDASLLYDLGVASYKLEEYEQAEIYFKDAARHSADALLKEQSYFNLGNSCVQQKKLKNLYDALGAYKDTLSINPDNVSAQKNKELVEKMIEEEKNKQNQKDQQNKQDSSDTKNNDQDDQQSSDQQQDSNKNSDDQQSSDDEKSDSSDQKDNNQNNKNDSSNDNASNQDSSQNDQGSSNSLQNNQSSDNSSSEKNDRNSSDKNGGKNNVDNQQQKGDDQKNGQQNDQQSADHQQDASKTDKDQGQSEKGHQQKEKESDKNKDQSREPGAQGADEKPAEKKDEQGVDQQQGKFQEHNAAQEQNKQDADGGSSGMSVGEEEAFGHDAAQNLSPLLQARLEEEKDKDEKLSKALTQWHVSKKMAGQYGQNCW